MINNMIERTLAKTIENNLNKRKIIILFGARQVGKTTLLESIFRKIPDTLWLSGDEPDVHIVFENISAIRLKHIFGKNKYVVLDEAQRIKDIGVKLKLIADQLPDVQVITSGSSSFDLANQINEPLTGRKWEYRMYPLSFSEMTAHHGLLNEKRSLFQRLVYGYYPEVVTKPGNEKEILKLLTDSYLNKDILMWERIKKPEKLVKLLQALAFQIGSQVSHTELGQTCGLDGKTVEKYLTLLEQCFVIFRLGSFSRNLRNELKNSRKIYFYDNGLRNAVIANFALAETRPDIGALWENFLVSERRKKLEYTGLWRNTWFWRTVEQKEIDYLEEGDGQLRAFEFKWNTKTKYKKPKQFLTAYPDSSLELITPENMEEFLL